MNGVMESHAKPSRPPNGGREDRLESWKEIAVYLRRGLRTVQRWERSEGLPVRRHLHSTAGTVYALKSELEAWRRARAQAPAGAPGPSPVSEERPDPRPTVRRRWKQAAGVLAVAVVAVPLWVASSVEGRRRLEVLPFRNLTGDPAVDLVSHGLTEETLTQMARVDARRLTVVARPLPPAKEPPARGRGADAVDGYLLEGSVRRVGNRFRVAARLLREADRRLLWAEAYEPAVTDGAAVQALGRSIAVAVSTSLLR